MSGRLSFSEQYNRSILENWKDHIQAVKEVKSDFTDERAARLAIMLENTQDALTKAELYEATQATDVGPFKKYAFDIITAVMPNLIAEELVSVQPLKQKLGQIFYLKYLFGSNKGAVAAGDTMFSPLEVGPTGYDNREYSSEYVTGEAIGDLGTSSYTGNLAYIPARPGTVIIRVGASSWTDDGNGAFTAAGALSAGTINYSTGAYSLTFSGNTASDVTVDYQFNLEYAPSTIPEVTLKVEEVAISARARKLKALYAFDSAYDLKISQGIDMDDALMEAVSTEIKHEIDGEIMRELITSASLTTSWNDLPPNAQISWMEHKGSFLDSLHWASNKIFQATKRAVGNFIVCGKKASDYIESFGAPRWQAATTGRKAGPHFAGILDGKFRVYKNPYYAQTEYLIGYKGDVFLDAGYVYAPYLPIFATQLLMMDDFIGRRGFATSYGKRLLNGNMYVRGAITSVAPA